MAASCGRGEAMIERSPYDLQLVWEIAGAIVAFYGLGFVAWMREVRLGRATVDDFFVIAVGPFLWACAVRDALLRFQRWYAPSVEEEPLVASVEIGENGAEWIALRSPSDVRGIPCSD